MDIIAWIVTGAAVGWIAFAVLQLNSERGKLIAMLIGAIGGVIGGKMIAPMFMIAPVGDLNIMSVLFAAAAASVLVFIGDQMQRRWGL